MGEPAGPVGRPPGGTNVLALGSENVGAALPPGGTGREPLDWGPVGGKKEVPGVPGFGRLGVGNVVPETPGLGSVVKPLGGGLAGPDGMG